MAMLREQGRGGGREGQDGQGGRGAPVQDGAAVESPVEDGAAVDARAHTNHSRVLEKYNFLQYEDLTVMVFFNGNG